MELKFKCLECDKEYNNNISLNTHIAMVHKSSDYYKKWINRDPNAGLCRTCKKPTKFISLRLGYNKYCTRTCAKTDTSNFERTCPVCNKIIRGNCVNQRDIQFSRHLEAEHSMTIKDCYDQFLKKPGEGICPSCGLPTKFRNYAEGYCRYCSHACSLTNIQKDLSDISVAQLEEKSKQALEDKELKEKQEAIQNYYRQFVEDNKGPYRSYSRNVRENTADYAYYRDNNTYEDPNDWVF